MYAIFRAKKNIKGLELREFPVLAEYLSSIPSTHIQLPFLDSVSKAVLVS